MSTAYGHERAAPAPLVYPILGALLAALVSMGCLAQDDGYSAGEPPNQNPPSSGMEPGTGIGSCSTTADVSTKIFAQKCTNAACHGDGANSKAGLDLKTIGVETRLMEVDAKTCSDQVLVVAGDSASSFLLAKLQPSPGCGAQMPKGGTPLTAEEINCVADWIEGLTTSGGGGGGGTPPGGGW